jgi:hypothetical protein
MNDIIESICKFCGKGFFQKNRNEKYLKKFCNHSCSASFSNSNRQRIHNHKLTSKCMNCQSIFSYSKNSSSGKFCSNKCQGEFRFINETIPNAEKGLITWPITLKKVISFKYQYNCFCCGIKEWDSKPISLHLDHIDGNSDNNLLENLRLLCPNCHSQTETFCGRNTKNTKRSTYNHRYRIKKLYNNSDNLPLS